MAIDVLEGCIQQLRTPTRALHLHVNLKVIPVINPANIGVAIAAFALSSSSSWYDVDSNPVYKNAVKRARIVSVCTTSDTLWVPITAALLPSLDACFDIPFSTLLVHILHCKEGLFRQPSIPPYTAPPVNPASPLSGGI
jgi:hypothetical protein